MYQISIVTPQILREVRVENEPCDTPGRVYNEWNSSVVLNQMFDPMKEHLVVFLLNTRRKIIVWNFVSVGTTNQVLIDASGVFRAAIVCGATAIIMAHNHPSGDSTPSDADVKITREMIRAGNLLRIEVLDHVIMGQKTEQNRGYTSLRELGYFYN